MLTPYPYQSKLIEDARAALAIHRRVLLVLPTAGGKTVCASLIAHGAMAKQKRTLFLAHRDFLVRQTSKMMNGIGVQHGIVAPGHTHTADLMQIGMIQTAGKRLHKLAPPDLIFCDEAHHSPAGTWDRVLKAFPNARLIGLTASPERLDGRGLKDNYDTMVLGPPVRELIDGGYIADMHYLGPEPIADLSGVKTIAGDLSVSQMSAMMNTATITGDAANHYRDHLAGAPSIAFCCDVKHAFDTAEMFRQRGWNAVAVSGDTDKTELERILVALGTGALNVLCAADLVSEGLDISDCVGIIMLRRSKSLALVMQWMGRGMRLKKDRRNGVILDHVGNYRMHGRHDTPREWSLEGRQKRPAAEGIRQCKECFVVIPAGTRPDCAVVGCPLLAAEPTPRTPPEAVPGQLVAVTSDLTTLPWAGGIDILRAQGEEWKALLARAGSRWDRLEEIRKLRKWHIGWTYRITGKTPPWARG